MCSRLPFYGYSETTGLHLKSCDVCSQLGIACNLQGLKALSRLVVMPPRKTAVESPPVSKFFWRAFLPGSVARHLSWRLLVLLVFCAFHSELTRWRWRTDRSHTRPLDRAARVGGTLALLLCMHWVQVGNLLLELRHQLSQFVRPRPVCATPLP